MENEIISYGQFDSALKRIEKANLKKHRESLSFGSMSNHCHGIIIEIQTDKKCMIVKKDWRAILKKRFLK